MADKLTFTVAEAKELGFSVSVPELTIKGDKGEKGDAGAVFTPSVSEDGIISWTNDGGLANPEGVDIKGPQGDKGDTGPQGEKGDKGDKGDTGETGATGAAFTYEDFTEEQLAALKGEKGDKGDKGDTGETGPQGEQGEKGDTGATGTTFTPSIEDGVLSWTNDGGLTNPDPVTLGSGGGGSGEQYYATLAVDSWYQQDADEDDEYWYACDVTMEDFDDSEQDICVMAADSESYDWLAANAYYELAIDSTNLKFSVQAKAIPSNSINIFYEIKSRGEA